MAKTSLAHPAHPVPEETRERGTCSGCDTTTKTLTAPRLNVEHSYRGPMYCLPCNPRFFTLDAQWSSLERRSANRPPPRAHAQQGEWTVTAPILQTLENSIH